MNGRVSAEDLAAAEVSHRQHSEIDWRFRRRALERPDWLRRSSFAVLDQPHPLLRYRLQSWPTFLDGSALEALRRDSVAVNQVIRRIPERLFDNDAERLAAFYRLGNPALVEALLMEPNGLDQMVARGDFIVTQQGARCIEMNFTPSLGGWDASIIAELHWECPVLPEVVREEGITPRLTNTLRIFLEYLLTNLERRVGAPEPPVMVAIVGDSDTVSASHRQDPFFNREISDACRRRGYEGMLRFVGGDELDFQRGDLALDGHRVHAVINLCHKEPLRQEVFRSFKAGRVTLFNSPLQRLLTDKQNLALLSMHEELFTPQEREVIRRVVPWTRQVEAAEVEWEGRIVDLPDLLRAERPSLVLKRGLGAGGEAVVVGPHETGEAWQRAVDLALAQGGWVVQEFLQSRPYLYQDGADGCSLHDVIWGPFLFGDEWGGAILRMQSTAAGGAVNLSLAATEGVIYEL